MKKRILLILLLLLFLTSCDKLENIIPDEPFGEWEGNYIYYHNYRSKTTGEDAEILFNEFTINDEKYTVEQFFDVQYHNNSIYYITHIKSDNYNGRGVIIHYSVITGEYELLYYGIDLLNFVAISDDYIVVNAYRLGDPYIYINLKTNEVIEIHCTSVYEWGYDFIQENYLNIVHWEDLKPIKILYVPSNYGCVTNLIKYDNKELLLIQLRSHEDEISHFESSLSMYNIKTKKLTTLVDISDNKQVNYCDGFYVIGDLKKCEYITNSKDQSTKIEKIVVNNELFKINFDDNEISSQKIYTFEDDKQHKILKLENNILQFKRTTVKKGNSIITGGVDEDNFYFNIKNNKEQLFYYPIDKIETEIKEERKIICGDYEYKIKIIPYDGVITDKRAVYLYRYNTKTKINEVMQFYVSDEYDRQSITTRYNEMYFNEDFNFNDLIILDN